MNNPFKGSGVALVTPFNADLSIDFEALKKLVRYQIDNGTDFLVVQGTTGESPVLNWEEKMEVLKVVQEENAGKLPIVFGVGGNNTLALGQDLKRVPAGVDGILSASPYYNKPTQKGIVEHYMHLASCTDLPIILYSVPGRTESNMTAETTLELSKINNIVATKEASGDLGQIMQIVKNKSKDFGVLSGDDAITTPLISVGVEGVISVVANAFPMVFSKMVHSALNGNFTEANEHHYNLLNVTNLFFAEGNPGGVKIALETLNIMKPNMRPPLYPVSDGLKAKIQEETRRIING